MAKEKFKDIEIDGRQWRVGRFDALTGSFIAYKLMAHLLPLVGKLPQSDSGFSGMLAAGIPTMPREDFEQLQRDCLKVCYELTLVGPVVTPIQVMLSSGSWGVAEIDDDPMLVMGLTIHSLVFNVSGFFGAGALKGLTDKFADLSHSSAPT